MCIPFPVFVGFVIVAYPASIVKQNMRTQKGKDEEGDSARRNSPRAFSIEATEEEGDLVVHATADYSLTCSPSRSSPPPAANGAIRDDASQHEAAPLPSLPPSLPRRRLSCRAVWWHRPLTQ